MSPKLILQLWRAAGLPVATAEYRFHETRKWRFDWSWPEFMVALEVQGGIWTRGRHTRGAALVKEWEKLNAAAAAGWVVFYCAPGGECRAELVGQLRGVLSEDRG